MDDLLICCKCVLRTGKIAFFRGSTFCDKCMKEINQAKLVGEDKGYVINYWG